MPIYEYKVIPAPRRGQKAKGVKSPEARFAHALQEAMNAEAAEGWEYLRADTLPCDERSGLTSTVTHYRNMLVFRRALDAGEDAAAIAATAPAATPLPASETSASGPAPLLATSESKTGADGEDGEAGVKARRFSATRGAATGKAPTLGAADRAAPKAQDGARDAAASGDNATADVAAKEDANADAEDDKVTPLRP